MKKTFFASIFSLAFILAGGSANAGLLDLLKSRCDAPCDLEMACENGGCDLGGCDGGGCDSIGCGCGLLGGFSIRPSDHCFDDFISPMSNFIFFEDPRTLTELRPIFFHHRAPAPLGTTGLDGGEINLLAAQVRLALTERLSFIAVKDGYIWAGDGDDIVEDGWADLSLGLKYNLVRDTCTGTLAAAGFTYEIPLGDEDARQSIGDGEFHLFGSAGQRFLNGDAHYLTTTGFRLPVDGDVQCTSFHWSNHFDVRLTNTLYAVTEVVWWHWFDDARLGLPLGVAGQDVFNLPSTNVDAESLVTQSVGLKCKPSGNREYGLSYEFPVSGHEDVIDYRIQVDMIFRY